MMSCWREVAGSLRLQYCFAPLREIISHPYEFLAKARRKSKGAKLKTGNAGFFCATHQMLIGVCFQVKSEVISTGGIGTYVK